MLMKNFLISFFCLIFLFLFNSSKAEHHAKGEKITPSWMVVDNGNKLVTFTLTSAYNGNNGSWNYNGFYNGSVNLVVPQGWNVNLKFVNPDGNYRHSVAVIKMWDGDNVPQEADESLVAIARAYSLSPAQGCLSCNEDVKFKAKNRDDYTVGKYSAFCGVPGHGGSGMWLGFSVKDGIDTPFVLFDKSAMDEGYAKPLL
tara:strand:- start:12298 stop:12894 length:597 start_codon:yes stop_codon:yes gene_type:complete